MALTFEVVFPPVVGISGVGRSDWDGVTATTFGFTGYDGVDWGSNDQHLLDGILQQGDPYSGGLNGKGVWIFLNAGDSGTGILAYTFDQNTPIFSLNGNPPISFNSLPAGFIITSLQFQVQGYNLQFAPDPIGLITLLLEGHTATPVITNPSGNLFKYDYDIDVLAVAFGGLSIEPTEFIGMEVRFDIQVVDDGAGSSSIPAVIGWVMTGEYIIFNQQFTLQNNSPVNTATPVTVTSDPNDPLAMDFEDILTVDITYIDSNGDPQTISVPPINWVTQTTNEFVFTLPTLPPDATVISIIVTSSQFSGSVTLGQLTTIFFTSASGIYTLTLNKRNDTLYIEEDLPNTIDVKIPDPFAKGNFYGS